MLRSPVMPSTAVASRPTCLHEVNRLDDMRQSPVAVYLGATSYMLAAMLFFYWLHALTAGRLPVRLMRAVAMLILNLLPVVVLRWRQGTVQLRDNRYSVVPCSMWNAALGFSCV